MQVPFTKVESIGNDFVLVDAGVLAERGISVPSRLAISACRRRFGVGADGLLVVDLSNGVEMRMFNPDGSEDFCGNGLRCTAVYAHERGAAGSSFSIIHGGKYIPAQILPDGRVETLIGPASYRPVDVPTNLADELFDDEILAGVVGSSLSTGSTHTVLWVDRLPADPEFLNIGPRLEHDARFPIRTSVIWAVKQAPDEIAIRIWERGGGETLGCGTGSSAAAADYFRRQGVGGALKVVNPGGTVTVSAERWDAPLRVVGRAEMLFEGEYCFEG